MANVPISNLTTTWNNVSTTFTGIKLNVTDTASAAGSLLADFQVGGVSRFRVNKSGSIVSGTNGVSTDPVISGSAGRGFYEGAGGIIFVTGSGDTNAKFLITQATARIASDCSFGWATGTSVQIQQSADLTLFRDAANTLAQRNGINAQTFRLYNTFTDVSNYERGFMRWNSNVLEIGHEFAGTGSSGRVNRYYLGPGSSNTYLTRAASSQHAQFFWNGTLSASVGLATQSSAQSSAYGLLLGGSDYGVGVISGFSLGTELFIAPSIMLNSSRNGANLNLIGGTASTIGNWNGGNIVVRGGTANGTGTVGNIIMDTLPTSNPVVAGALWNNAGVLSVSAG